MSQLFVDNIKNTERVVLSVAPSGAVVTGVVTATTANVTGNQTVGGNVDW